MQSLGTNNQFRAKKPGKTTSKKKNSSKNQNNTSTQNLFGDTLANIYNFTGKHNEFPTDNLDDIPNPHPELPLNLGISAFFEISNKGFHLKQAPHALQIKESPLSQNKAINSLIENMLSHHNEETMNNFGDSDKTNIHGEIPLYKLGALALTPTLPLFKEGLPYSKNFAKFEVGKEDIIDNSGRERYIPQARFLLGTDANITEFPVDPKTKYKAVDFSSKLKLNSPLRHKIIQAEYAPTPDFFKFGWFEFDNIRDATNKRPLGLLTTIRIENINPLRVLGCVKTLTGALGVGGLAYNYIISKPSNTTDASKEI